MNWLLLWWLMSDNRYDEPEHPKYFREPKPRELTKEEKRKNTIFLIIFGGIVISALFIYQDVLCRMSQIAHALH